MYIYTYAPNAMCVCARLTLNPKPQTLNPKPSTLNPKPGPRRFTSA